MVKASKALELATARFQEGPQERKNYREEDVSFANIVYEMLCNIQDSREKTIGKTEF